MGIVRTGLTKTVGQSNAQVVNGSLRFDSGSSQYLSRTPGSAGSRKTWTFSCWMKRGGNYNSRMDILSTNTATSGNYLSLQFSSGNAISLGYYNGEIFTTSAVYRDFSAWMHVVLTLDTTLATAADRVKLYVNGSRVTAFSTDNISSVLTQYSDQGINAVQSHSIGRNDNGANVHFDGQLSNVYFIDGQALDASYFGFTDPLTNTWRPKKFKPQATPNNGTTWSNGSVTTGTNKGNITQIFDGSPGGTGAAPLGIWTDTGAQLTYTFPSTINYNSSVEVFAFKKDTRPSTLIYIALGTSLSGATNYQSSVTTTGSWVTIASGSGSFNAISYQDQGDVGGYDGVRVDGVVLLDNDTTNMGANGFYLPFDTDGVGTIGIGTDRSGRGNHWTANGFVTTAAGIQTNPNIMPDSPSGISFSTAPTAGIGTTTGMTKPSNYATLNPLQLGGATYSGSQPNPLTNGNLDWSRGSGQSYGAVGNIPMVSGKYYWECTVTNVGDTNYGLGVIFQGATEQMRDGQVTVPYAGMYQSSGIVRKNTNQVATYATYTTGDVIGMGYNADTRDLSFYKNGVSQGTLALDAPTAPYVPWVFLYFNSTTSCSMNFGQKPFKYAPPSGFLPLCTANLPRPTTDAAVRPDKYVGVTTYLSNGSARNITIGWKPDLVWIKQRDGSSTAHTLHDTVRGVNKHLASSSTDAEVDVSQYGGGVTAFNNDGFSVGTWGAVNENTRNYVAWTWKAGGNSNTYNINDVGYSTASAAGLTAGTITPTGASINTKSGFSIITYTGNGTSGATVPHGLGVAPSMIILRQRSAGVSDWRVYFSVRGNTGAVILNTTTNFVTDSSYWNNTTPSSSVFTLGNNVGMNGNGSTYVSYCWAEIPGFSKFGSFTGTGNANGPMIITGFRPRWIMFKNSSASGDDWAILDTSRNTYNEANSKLWPNTSAVESTLSGNNSVDFLSNGFKLRSDNNATNSLNNTMLYAAFAETPTQNLFGGQSNAR